MRKYFLILCYLFIFLNFGLLAQNDFYKTNKIREVRIYFKEKNWDYLLDSLFTCCKTEGRLTADMSIEGKMFYNVGIRYKGYSSCNVNYIKNPLNIDLDCSNENQNYQGFVKIKLSNIIHDPSFVREIISYEIARQYMPAPEANFANVYINDTLIGLYSNVEAIDKSFVKRHYGTKTHTFFKGSPKVLQYPYGQNANLAYTHGPDTTGYMPYYILESDTGWSDVLNLIYTLNNDTGNISNVLNIDRVLWMHAFNYALLNLDSYIGYSQNYYMYKDDNGLFNPIVWDLNMAFGSFRESDGSNHFNGLTIDQMKVLDPLQHLTFSISPRPLMKNLFKNQMYRKMYLAHIRTIVQENFSNNFYLELAQKYQNMIDSDVLNDPNRFYSYADFHTNLTDVVYSTGTVDMYPGLKDITEARTAYLESYPGFQGAPVISDINHYPEIPDKNEKTIINAKISGASYVFLAYKFNSTDVFLKELMYDDGNHNDGIAGDSIYGASIYPQGPTIQYYIYAQNQSSGIFSPERAEFEFYTIQPKITPGSITINELSAANNIEVSETDGSTESWIEFYNNTNENLYLKGLYVSDEDENITKWAFPDTLIKKNNFLIAWADNNITESGLHLNFSISADGGKLILGYNSSDIVDSLTYDPVFSEKTIGRYPNGTGLFDYMQASFSDYNFTGTVPRVNFHAYPNPASGKIYFELNNLNGNVLIEIFNVNGEKTASEEHYFNRAQMPVNGISIDISGLPRGVYYVRILNNETNLSKSIIVY